MYTKEQIIDELKRLAEKTGGSTLSQKDFELRSTIPMSTLRFHLGSWERALKDAGLAPAPDTALRLANETKKEPQSEDELLQDLLRIEDECGEVPSLTLIIEKGIYGIHHYRKRWKSISEAYLLARRRFPVPAGEKTTPSISHLEETMPERVIAPVKPLLSPGIPAQETQDHENPLVLEDLEVESQTGEIMFDEPEDSNEVTDSQIDIQTHLPPWSQNEPAPLDTFADNDLDSMEIEMENPATSLQENRGTPVKQESPSAPPPIKKATIEKKPVQTFTLPDRQVMEPVKPIVIKKEILEAKEAIETNKEVRGPEEIDTRKTVFIPQTIKPRQGQKRRILTGEPIHFRGLRFAPVNKQGVIYIFGMVAHELGFIVESLLTGEPDAQARRKLEESPQHWEQVRLQFAFKSSEFAALGFSEEHADLIVCWIHDWDESPLEILELRSTINYLAP